MNYREFMDQVGLLDTRYEVKYRDWETGEIRRATYSQVYRSATGNLCVAFTDAESVLMDEVISVRDTGIPWTSK